MSTSDIKNSRSDLSPYLFHFTKGTDDDAKITLDKILHKKCLTSNSNCICFTEMPLTSSLEMFQYMDRYQHPMYAPYGIAFPRDLLFHAGARPVIYSNKAEIAAFPQNLQWRSLELTPGIYDFSWLREWRINTSLFDFGQYKKDLIVIVRKNSELLDRVSEKEKMGNEEYLDCSSDFIDSFPEHLTMFYRSYKGISLEAIKREKIQSDSLLYAKIEGQQNGENL